MTATKPRWGWDKEECQKAFYEAVKLSNNKADVAKILDAAYRPERAGGTRRISEDIVRRGLTLEVVRLALRRLYPEEDTDSMLRKFDAVSRRFYPRVRARPPQPSHTALLARSIKH